MADNRNRNVKPANGKPAAAANPYAINLDNFSKRLKMLYSHWNKHNTDLWGSSSALAIATPPVSEDLRYLKSSALNIWLVGYEFPETIMVFLKKQIHFLCSQKKASLLDVVKKSAREAIDVEVVIHVKAKGDDGTGLMDTIFRAIHSQASSGDHNVPIVGHISREAPEGKFLETWDEKLKSAKFELSDVTTGFSDLFAVKDETELTNVKKAAFLTSSVMRQFVVPKLEKAIDEERKVSHSTLMDDTEKTILEPGRIKAYEVLLKAHEAAIGALKSGNKVNSVYQAAVSVVEKEAPELAANLTKTAGTGIGLEFRETGLSLNAKNDRILKPGMVFNVSLGFQNLQTETNNPKTRKYSVLLADTVIVAEDNGNETLFSKTTLRSDNHEMSKEELRRQHQAELARQKNEETARRLAGGGANAADNRGAVKTVVRNKRAAASALRETESCKVFAQ
ncbi:hypothetical protein GOBAR_AA35192 [Gossypium barbadense]|uniref:FACT complex subunit n=1 Tax=Gossypium barbadense TaxID=3634 RepID=A0A2P5W329_GOSBA|nr:hypothetical protein GOBAR_AA35192 [Gossypium barbadense]